METWYTAVSSYVDEHHTEILETLMELMRVPSVSEKGKDGYPFGPEVDRALHTAAKQFSDAGFAMEVKPGGYALAELSGEGDGIGLFGHADVVPVTPKDWTVTAPFTPVLKEDGYLYGRGADDNKAGVVASLFALKALQAAGVNLRRRISIYVGGSEETGMQDIESYVTNERVPAVSLVPDAGFPVGYGEKNIMRIRATSRKPMQDIVRFDGGMAYNVILDTVTVERRDGTVSEFQGLTKHAAHPEGSENAAVKAAKALIADATVPQGDRERLSVLIEAIEDFYGNQYGIAGEDVFGKLTVANGITQITDAGQLLFTLDLRFGTALDRKAVREKIVAWMDTHGFDAEVVEDDPGYLNDASGAELDAIIRTCRELGNAPDAKPYLMSGGTYARKLPNAYPINHSRYWTISKGLPAGHGEAHQSDECLEVDALFTGIKILATMIARLDQLQE